MRMILDVKELAELRKKPKEVRFCPSCGYRRLRSHALHFVCQVCHFSFMAYDATQVSEVKILRQASSTIDFETFATLQVPRGREGVQALVDDLLGAQPTSEGPSSRFSDV